MKKLTVLLEHIGEISYTPHDPVDCEVLSVDGDTVTIDKRGDISAIDITEQCTRLISHDFWEPTQVDRWELKQITVPDWFTGRDFYKARRLLQQLDGLEVSRAAFYKLHGMHSNARQIAIDLLKVKKFRSAFRRSLRDQLDKWLHSDSVFPSPFSPKQWECLSTYRRAA
jgi:hypothetical protein